MSSTAPVHYVRIAEGEPLPDLQPLAPYRAVVVLDDDHTEEWRDEVSAWLVESGCLYMMAWGPGCATWDDSVDWASLRQFDLGDTPDDRFVMTTWHEKESLDETFRFAASCAHHGDSDLRNTIIVHVGKVDRREEMLERFAAAQDG